MLPDTVLGHYRILAPLGKGGMGEVYAAEDTKLKRTVALKILPQAMGIDADRRKRFEREAQAVAALNHPNIVTIFSVEEAAGVLFLTMEAVEGQTLKDMLVDGPLPLDRLLRVATAVSDAMAAAHQRGITHRDLKPANVMVTPDGRVKVLDFGLAKLQEAQPGAGGDHPTMLRADDLTGEGRIIGTVAYMSPEQAEGKPVDQRSDIFSLGVMLHEMSAGERPFKGDTDISVISAILKDTPTSITDINPSLPPGLARIVRRCLAKDPGRRYQTAIDVRNDLEELKQDLDSGIQPLTSQPSATSMRAAQSRSRRPATQWLLLGGAAVVVIGAGVFAWNRARTGGGQPAVSAFAADRFTRLTDNGAAFLAELSPDGRYVVHVKRENGLPSVWVRQTATTSDVRIVPPADVQYDGLTFSPDANYVYYVTYPPTRGVGSLYRIPVLGGAAIRLIEDIDSAPAFSPDGRSFAFIRGEVVRAAHHLMIANADGTGARSLADTSGEMPFQNETPAWSPDGRTILVPVSDNRQKLGIVAVDASTGAVKQVGDTWLFARNVKWMPDGRTFIMDGVDRISTSSPQLWLVSFPSGERRRITNDLNGYTGVSLSADGRRLATVQTMTESRVWVVPAAGGTATDVALASGRLPGRNGIAWTPDGRLVFTAQAGGLTQVWIANADGSNTRQLTNADRFANSPVVSPDGSSIYYNAGGEAARIWRMGLDGSDQRPIPTQMEAFRPLVSPDNQWIYFTTLANGRNKTMKMKTDGSAVSAVSDAVLAALDVSPDGTQLLGLTWNQAQQRPECAVVPTSGGEPRLLDDLGVVGALGTGTCRWGRSAGTLWFVVFREARMNVFERPMTGGPERQVTHFPRDAWPQIFAGAVSRDGRIAVVRGNSTSDVVLIEAAESGR